MDWKGNTHSVFIDFSASVSECERLRSWEVHGANFATSVDILSHMIKIEIPGTWQIG